MLLTIYLSGDEDILLDVGDDITVLPNKLRAVCPSGNLTVCQLLPFSLDTVAILFPSNPITPKVSLSGSRSIGRCDDVVINPTNSYGYGNRQWSNVTWYVFVGDGTGGEVDASTQQFLRTNYSSDTRSIVTVPNSILQWGATYTFQLRVINRFGLDAAASISINIGSDFLQTSVTISGPYIRKVERWQTLYLSASANLPACVSAENKTMTFKWKVYIESQYMPSMFSASADDRIFKLPPFTLDLKSYKFIATVTIRDPSTSQMLSTSFTSAIIDVQPSGIVALIKGGQYQSMAQSISGFTLDATESYDLSYPKAGSSLLSYKWECTEILPNFGSICGNYITMSPVAKLALIRTATGASFFVSEVVNAAQEKIN